MNAKENSKQVGRKENGNIFTKKIFLSRKEVFRKNKIFITYYYDNEKKKFGNAFMEADAIVLHFYWTGDWKWYDSNGKHVKIATFVKGEEISEQKWNY